MRSALRRVDVLRRTLVPSLSETKGPRLMTTSAHDETAAAQRAATSGAASDNGPTIFDKILSREIPASVVFEDDLCMAFRDVNPQAPSHLLVIPKRRGNLSQLSKAQDEDKDILGHLMLAASKVARQEGLAESGYRIVVNDGVHGCQSVYHIHLHIIGGRQLTWPPG